MDAPRSRRIEFPRKVYRDGDDPRLRISSSGLMLLAQIAATDSVLRSSRSPAVAEESLVDLRRLKSVNLALCGGTLGYGFE